MPLSWIRRWNLEEFSICEKWIAMVLWGVLEFSLKAYLYNDIDKTT